MSRRYVELHFHLDGGIDETIAERLLEMLGRPAPAGLGEKLRVPEGCRDLEEFLQYFTFPLSLLQTRECISEAVYLEQEAMKKEGLLYGEIRFAPQLHTGNGLSQKDVVRAALDGLERSDFPCNLILCCMRGRGNEEENRETVRQALEHRCEDGGVTAVDLAGDEAGYPTARYKELFRKVTNCHMPLTIHAGEAAGSESIRSALEMGAFRIGHGVALYQDSQLIEEVRNRAISLEMCPTSNLLTRVVENLRDYPLLRYLETGIRVTVNTDDKAICGTTLAQEFQKLRIYQRLTAEQETRLLLNAAEAAFTSPGRKEWIKQEIRKGQERNDSEHRNDY